MGEVDIQEEECSCLIEWVLVGQIEKIFLVLECLLEIEFTYPIDNWGIVEGFQEDLVFYP